MKSWSAPRQLDDFRNVRLVESGVDRVGDPVSARDPQRVLLEHAEGTDRSSATTTGWSSGAPRLIALGVVEPRPDRQLERSQTVP